MRARVPSVATIADRLGLERSQARTIRTALERAQDGETGPTAALKVADRVLDAHGVEHFSDGRYTVRYVNTGDAYTPTVLHDRKTDLFYVTSWGDYAEAQERRGRRFP